MESVRARRLLRGRTGCRETQPLHHPTDGTMVPFHTDNAAVLAPMMNLSVADATAVINAVRALPFGAVVSSTPAIEPRASLDPTPDADYPAFRTDNEKRRSIVRCCRRTCSARRGRRRLAV